MFWAGRSITFIGGYFENGAWPCASSSAVIPNDHISALYKDETGCEFISTLLTNKIIKAWHSSNI